MIDVELIHYVHQAKCARLKGGRNCPPRGFMGCRDWINHKLVLGMIVKSLIRQDEEPQKQPYLRSTVHMSLRPKWALEIK